MMHDLGASDRPPAGGPDRAPRRSDGHEGPCTDGETPDFRPLAEHSSESIVVVSGEGSILYLNRAACVQAGVSPEEVCGHPLTVLLDPPDAERVMAASAATKPEAPEARHHETRLLHRSGEGIPVDLAVVAVEWRGEAALALFMRSLAAERRAHHALSEIEERWRAIASVIPDLVFVLDEDGRYLEILASQEELLAAPAARLKGRLMREVLPEDRAEVFYDVVRRTIEEGTTQSLEYSLDLDGGVAWFEGRSALLRSTIGGKHCVVWIARDVTARKAAEQVREHQHQFMRDVLDAIPNPVFVKDHEHRFLVLNDAVCNFIGRERGELLGKSDFDFFPEEEARWFVAKDSEVLASGLPNEVEESLTNAAGERRWIVTRKKAGVGPDGKPILIGSFTDLTERRLMEEQLRRRDEVLEAVNVAATLLLGSKAWTECIDEILVALGGATGVSRIVLYRAITGRDGAVHGERVAGWDDEAGSMPPPPPAGTVTGLSAMGLSGWIDALRGGEVVSERLAVYPESVQARIRGYGVRSLIGVPVLTGEDWWGFLALLDCAVEREWAQGELDALRLAGNILGAAIQRQDVARALEESETRYKGQLRSLALELALTEQRERKRLAAELHDRIGQALAVSKMKLGALRAPVAPETRAEMIEDAGRLIDQTIQDTRTLTFELSPPMLYELGLEPALDWLVESLRARHGIEAVFVTDGDPKPLEQDISGLLFHCVQELMFNAVKHGSPRRVKVSSRRVGGEIRIDVEDDGRGFDPTQVGSTWRSPHGFGLFSIRERLTPLGGRIEVASRPGQGTRVSLAAALLSKESNDSKTE